jgi:hypothetical protein
MANQLYAQGAAHILGKTTKVDLVLDAVKALFYNSTFNNANEFVSDLTVANIVARSGALGGKTVTNGTFDANDITFAAVTGAAFTHVLLYKDSGAGDTTSPLLANFDIPSFTPTGADITVVWNTSGLFSIA